MNRGTTSCHSLSSLSYAMPRGRSSPMNGPVFAPKPGFDTASTTLENSPFFRETGALYDPINNLHAELPVQKPMVANSNSTLVSEPSFNHPFESPVSPQNFPTLSLFHEPDIKDDIFQDQEQLWSPEVNFETRSSSTTASQLLPNEPIRPAFEHLDKANSIMPFGLKEKSVSCYTNSNEDGISSTIGAMSSEIPDIPVFHTFSTPHQYCNISGDENSQCDFEMFLGRNSFKLEGMKEIVPDCKNIDKALANNGENSKKNVKLGESSPTFRMQTFSAIDEHAHSRHHAFQRVGSYGSGYKASSKLSLDNCLHEFHMKEGKFMFADETAMILKLLKTPRKLVTSRMSPSKVSNTLQRSKNPRMISKPSPWAGLRRRREVSKDMKSRLGSFQVQLKNDHNLSSTSDESFSTESE
ncbi:hypothetical protein METBIDRAFT_191368 [Metschnikowia bicuspidata var. bicuspidata NRRL YB-4993]|uniref:Uncharacterized protein n=1 Tax=Metschnikowia bicuspidata var. bicuspidata NRRL YB-4993 TaxID=869754 RepID=A0A1A0HCW4_9ASCO|nr:hypothetical protein METBIDRAFT_191368 [Metschnikowia bicuspidata var. bicuspidata NRRL YB-4993]OBA21722.1 hypothetical protein METBIDRAFT_191368 [Metschnikowia bicuspidata var. bicuspidata NRRL YB-4993]